MNSRKAVLAAFLLIHPVFASANGVYDQNSAAFADQAKKTPPIHISSDDPNFTKHSEAASNESIKDTKAPLPKALSEPRTIRIENPVSSLQSSNKSLLFMFQDLTVRTDEDREKTNFVSMDFRRAQIDALTEAAARKPNQ